MPLEGVSQLVESASEQKLAAEECAQVLRIVVDEGTTVIVPELLRQLSADMSAVAVMLEKSDATRAAGQSHNCTPVRRRTGGPSGPAGRVAARSASAAGRSAA